MMTKEIKIGEWVDTPRFCKVQIDAVYDDQEAAWEAGFTEPTHYRGTEYGVLGKSLDAYCMEFAAYKKS